MAIEVKIPQLRADQWDIVSCGARIIVCAMGRRWGKSVTGQVLSLTVAVNGGRVAWVVPTYKNGRPLWEMINKAIRPLVRKGRVRVSQVERTVEFLDSGGFLGVFSATNEDAIRGEAFHVVVIDEAARVPETTWTDVIMPTLADYEGTAFIISTPKGRGNWFHREFMKGAVYEGHPEPDDGYRSFTAPSSSNPSPAIRRMAEHAKANSSERTYRQEWLAQFVQDGGEVFQRVRSAATAERQTHAVVDHRYVIGIDWGRENDYTVFAVYDVTLNAVVYLERHRHTPYTEGQLMRLRKVVDRFNPELIIPEQNSVGMVLIELLLNEGYPVWPEEGYNMNRMTKPKLVDNLAYMLEQGGFTFYFDDVIISELESYEQRKLPGGRMVYSAPSGMHDDCVIAIGLALLGREELIHSPTMRQGRLRGRSGDTGKDRRARRRSARKVRTFRRAG